MEFEKEALFKQLVSNSGMNLYLGAGFSAYAYNSDKESLPLGNIINERLIEMFSLDKSRNFNLSKSCQKIKKDNKDALNRVLKEIYMVKSYDDRYAYLVDLPINNIITLNIDNLIEKIYEEKTDTISLIDSKVYGSLEKSNSVNLYKIHGSVTYPMTEDMSFTEKELTDLFLREKMLFETVSFKLSTAPTIFWGIGIMDNNTLDLICNSEAYSKSKNPKWIVIYPTKENLQYVDDFQEQGFNVIKADTMELIEYLHDMDLTKKAINKTKRNYADIFPKNFISDKLRKISVRRPVIDFFAGSEPQISDVLSNNVTRISYFNNVANMILSKNTVLITGIPGCGKSTLLLQLAFSEEISGIKFWFNSITCQEAENLRKLLMHEQQVVTVFIDNLYNNMEAFKVLREMTNVNLVLAERALNFDYIKRSINIESQDIIDISNLCSEDVQRICKGMNKSGEDAVSLLSSNNNVSLLEIVFYASTNTLISERIRGYINDLRAFEDPNLKINLLELFALINYTSYCGVPCSMDMLLFYFHEDIDDYKDLLYALNKMTKIIVQYEEVIEEIEDQDYLIMRSKLFAERSLKLIDKITMGKVLKEFWNRINPHIIYRYDVMKRRAYDADIITNVYNVKDGQDFYEKMFLINKSPFVKHQYAIFLLRKKQFDLAWKQIDQAYTEREKKVFTIANTHAVIMFEMNIGAEANSDKELYLLKETMQKSFSTLEYCITQDVRINYHALIYARNTIRYYERFGDDQYSEKYIDSSISQLEEILHRDEYMYYKIKMELKQLLMKLKQIKGIL